MNKWIYRLITLALLAVIAYSGYQIFSYYKEVYENNRTIEKIEDIYFKPSASKNVTGIKALKGLNEDAVGWLTIPNTAINYPVVQGVDNDFYLNHTFEKNYSTVGSIFVDYRNKIDEPLQNIIIYGHNRKDGSMFHNLRKYLKEPNNESIRKITLSLNGKEYTGEIISAYEAKMDDEYYKLSFESKSAYDTYITQILKRSVLKGNYPNVEGELLITLSTCSYNAEENRFVAHAILREITE